MGELRNKDSLKISKRLKTCIILLAKHAFASSPPGAFLNNSERTMMDISIMEMEKVLSTHQTWMEM